MSFATPAGQESRLWVIAALRYPASIMKLHEASLAATLHLRRVEAMCRDAELTREHPNGDERTEQAQQLVRKAMRDHSLGQITANERDRILGILSFAVEAMRLRADTQGDDPLPSHHDSTPR